MMRPRQITSRLFVLMMVDYTAANLSPQSRGLAKLGRSHYKPSVDLSLGRRRQSGRGPNVNSRPQEGTLAPAKA
jgi:hypothetical protein